MITFGASSSPHSMVIRVPGEDFLRQHPALVAVILFFIFTPGLPPPP